MPRGKPGSMSFEPISAPIPSQFRVVTLESGEQILVNMETVAWIRRHETHEPAKDDGHTHAAGVKLIQLRSIAGGDIVIQDDGSWWL